MAAASLSRPERGRAWRHALIGVIVVGLVPAASWLDGSGQLAWTMFSRTGQYRLVLAADGAALNPTELAARAAAGSTSIALAGADHWKHHDVMRATLRRHLGEVVRLACRVRPAREISGRLEERLRSDAPVRTTTVTVQCAP